ncbi:MAG: TolC family protein [Gemmataceae bacterium]|nr:TolC family protein [Gemmataceae bacterium]
MDRAGLSPLPRPLSPRRLTMALCLAWLLPLPGCSGVAPLPRTPQVVARGQYPSELPPAQAGRQAPTARLEFHQGQPPPAVEQAPPPPAKTLPINLDVVLRLARDQNGQVAVAREKLNEAFAQSDVAARAWLPDLWVGTTYYRHEGGIQNEDGTLTHSSFGALFAGVELGGRFDLREAVFQKIDAERKVWQQKGELSKLTSENLLDAASTYVDLLAARAGEAIALEVEKSLRALLKDAEALAKIDPGAGVEVSKVRAEISGQLQVLRKLREGARSATAKLLYLLGLDSDAELVVMDRYLLPLSLVDTSGPVEGLVEQALVNGPGVRELEGLLNLVNQASARAQGLGQYLPIFDFRMADGAFGAGPGSRSSWDNRWDLSMSLRYNLTPWLTVKDRQRATQAKIQQVHLSYKDLRDRLTMGVREGYEAVHSGREQIELVEQQIKYARDTYDRSKFRLKERERLKGTPTEVLLGIALLGRAQISYLQALRDYDKAQLRLLVLLGLGAERCHP